MKTLVKDLSTLKGKEKANEMPLSVSLLAINLKMS